MRTYLGSLSCERENDSPANASCSTRDYSDLTCERHRSMTLGDLSAPSASGVLIMRPPAQAFSGTLISLSFEDLCSER